jgi:predicted enzyme related to lactoylglutathione lyase/adenylylsulfate kinase-like enzyme
VSVPTLLIISGPIASGKSTVAQLLATESRAGGHTVAVVDLDRLYMMLDHRSPMDDPRTWRAARRAAAALADQFLVDGAELVIVEGTFWTQAERDEFAHRLSTAFGALFVTLHVSVDEALTRVQADVGRRASRVPELLRASHAEFASAPSIAGDVTIDSTHANVMEVASLIKAALASQRGPHHAAGRPLFVDVDCVQIPVPDLDAGLAFYRDALGHTLIWRTHSAAGLRLADSSTELVIQTERPELEPNLTVASADAAAERFVDAGGMLLAPPFEIAIGRCAVVQDPWGNRLVVLDRSQGRLLTDVSGRVRLGPDGRALTQFPRELPEARSDRSF